MNKLIAAWSLSVVFFLPIAPISGQSQRTADSLIFLLKSPIISNEQRFNIVRQIAHDHPKYQIALNYSMQAVELAKKIGNPQLIAVALEELSINHWNLGNTIESTEASLGALEIFRKLGDSESAAATLVQLGSNAISNEEFPEAIKYLKSAISVYTEFSSHKHVSLSFLNLGEAYRLNERYDSATHYFLRALKLKEKVEQPERDILIAYSTGNLGMVYNSLGQLDTAQSYLDSAIQLTRQLGDPYSSSVYQADLGQLYARQGHQEKAKIEMLAALKMAEANGLKEQIRDFSEMLVELYQGQGGFKHALQYQQLFQVYQDSLVNKKNVQEIERLKAGYEIDKRESEISLLSELNRQQRYLAIGLFLGLALISIFSILIYRSRKRVERTNTALIHQKEVVSKREQEKALLLKELNHRVKNNLQMVASLLNLQENQLQGHPAEAAIASGKYRVEALSLIHRKLYSEDHHTEIDVCDYIEELVMNLCYSYGKVDKPQFDLAQINIGIDQAVPLALIVNELVTNALKHAYEGIRDPELHIGFKEIGKDLVLMIQDNGIGFHANYNSSSFGMSLVYSLVGQLDGDISNHAAAGTSWEICMPKMVKL